MMKKILVTAAVAALSNAAFATDVCTGEDPGAPHDVTAGTNFITSNFTVNCSANVYLSYGEDSNSAWVGSASKKGKFAFSGSTNGGGVTPMTSACAATGCTASDAQGAMDHAASGT